MQGNTETGRQGEELAAAYLQRHGFQILVRNWRHARLEIDIIASKNGLLHFVEVKTRTSVAFGLPEESVSDSKIKNLLKAGAAYQYQHKQWGRVQYDILSIILQTGSGPEFYLIEDIYL